MPPEAKRRPDDDKPSAENRADQPDQAIPPSSDPLAQALATLAAEKEQRKRECERAINAALERFGCSLVTYPYLTADGRIEATARVQALDPPAERRNGAR